MFVYFVDLFKGPTLCLIDSLYCFLWFLLLLLLISVLNLIISCHLVLLGKFVSFCSKVFKCSVNSLVRDFFQLLMWAFIAINFLLNTAFIVSHKFGYVLWSFSLNFRKFFNFSLYFFLDPLIIHANTVIFTCLSAFWSLYCC